MYIFYRSMEEKKETNLHLPPYPVLLQVTVGTLLTYAHVSEKQYLDPATAFVALSLFNILKQPMNQLPNCISELVQVGMRERGRERERKTQTDRQTETVMCVCV